MIAELGLWIYLIGLLGKIEVTSVFILFLGLFLLGIKIISNSFDVDYGRIDKSQMKVNLGWKNNFTHYFSMLFLIFVLVFLPSERTAYLILGLNVTQNAYELNNQDVDDTTKLIFDNVKKKLKDALEDKKK